MVLTDEEWQALSLQIHSPAFDQRRTLVFTELFKLCHTLPSPLAAETCLRAATQAASLSFSEHEAVPPQSCCFTGFSEPVVQLLIVSAAPEHTLAHFVMTEVWTLLVKAVFELSRIQSPAFVSTSLLTRLELDALLAFVSEWFYYQ